MQTYVTGGGIINLTINNMDSNHLPSPSPAPSPESISTDFNSSMVIEAKQVQNEYITCNKIDGVVFINYNMGEEKYTTRIVSHGSDIFWENNKLLFQNDINVFYRIIKDTFERNTDSHFKWSIIQKNNDKLFIQLENQNIYFGFKTTIELTKEDSEINILKKRIVILEKENEKMCEDINLLKIACKDLLKEADNNINRVRDRGRDRCRG